MTPIPRILFVGDENELKVALSQELHATLGQRDFVIEPDGDTAIARAAAERFDLVALDFKVPSASRLDTFRKFQRWGIQTPVLLWTKDSQLPCDAPRSRATESEFEKPPVYEFSNVRVDCQSGHVTRGGTPIFVSAREFKMLKYFIRRRGQDVSRKELLTDVWGFDPSMRTRTIDVHLAWIRQKLEAKPRRPEFFLTIRGLGYRFAG